LKKNRSGLKKVWFDGSEHYSLQKEIRGPRDVMSAENKVGSGKKKRTEKR